MEKKRSFIIFGVIVGGAFMGGCSSYSNNFDCPYGKGAGCSSISKVNTMVDNHEIDLGEGDHSNKMRNIHIFYGPEQLSKVITVQEPLAS